MSDEGRAGVSAVLEPGTEQPGDFRISEEILVQPRLNRLVRGEVVEHLEPKAMAVLVHLAERRGQVATREEIFDEVWEGVAVTDHALTRVISDLRRALGEKAQDGHPKILETIRGVGYRLKMASLPGGAAAAGSEVRPPERGSVDRSASRQELPAESEARPKVAEILALVALSVLLALGAFWLSSLETGGADPPAEIPQRPSTVEPDSPDPSSRLGRVLAAGRELVADLAGPGAVAPAEIALVLEVARQLEEVGRPREALEVLALLGSDPTGLDGIPSARRPEAHLVRAAVLSRSADLGEAIRHAESGERQAREQGGPAASIELRARALRGTLMAERGAVEGLEMLEESLERARSSSGTGSELSTDILCHLGEAHFYLRQLLEAEAFLRQCGRELERQGREDSLLFAELQAFQAGVHWVRGERQEALDLTLAARERAIGVLGGRASARVVELDSNVGTLLSDLGRPVEAEGWLREALAGSVEILGEESRQTATILQSLGLLLWREGRMDEAVAIQQRNVAIRRGPGQDPVYLPPALGNLAGMLRDRGELERSLALGREALDLRLSLFGADNLGTAFLQAQLGRTLLAMDRREEAARLLTAALETRERELPSDSELLAETRDWVREATRDGAQRLLTGS